MGDTTLLQLLLRMNTIPDVKFSEIVVCWVCFYETGNINNKVGHLWRSIFMAHSALVPMFLVHTCIMVGNLKGHDHWIIDNIEKVVSDLQFLCSYVFFVRKY